MIIYKYKDCDIKDWYVCYGFLYGKPVWGAGRTYYLALIDAIK